MSEIIDMDEARMYKELEQVELPIDAAVRKASLESGDTRLVPCPRGPHRFDFCVKRIGERGDAKVQFMCEACGYGAEGWFPAGAWANNWQST